jgi:hypothetical protein
VRPVISAEVRVEPDNAVVYDGILRDLSDDMERWERWGAEVRNGR